MFNERAILLNYIFIQNFKMTIQNGKSKQNHNIILENVFILFKNKFYIFFKKIYRKNNYKTAEKGNLVN